MRTKSRRAVLTLLLIPIVAAACGSSSDNPSPLDSAFENAPRLTQTAQAQRPTHTPWPTAWPTPTERPRRTPRPSPTPYPTRDRSNATEEPIGDYVVPGEWQMLPFEDDSGHTHTLQDYLGRAVVLHTLSASCELCIEQQQMIVKAAQDRIDYQLLTDTVFIALDVIPQESPDRLKSSIHAALGDAWATVEHIMSDESPADYVFGSASRELLAALEREIGPEVTIPESVTVIVIEPDGIAHLMVEGLVDWHDLRDAITLYGNPPPDSDE